MGATWQPVEIDTLTKLIDLGWSARQIADAMGKTRNSVLGVCHRQRIQLARAHGNSAGIGLRRAPAVARKPLAKKLAPKVEPPAITDPCQPKSLEALGSTECHWAIADRPNFLFCAMPARHKGYCEHHAFMAYNREPAQKKPERHAA